MNIIVKMFVGIYSWNLQLVAGYKLVLLIVNLEYNDKSWR